MTVVVYKCDVCAREITLPQNPQGLETISRCVITQGCRGHLHQLSVKQDFIRGSFPTAVANLKDWTQRKILYTHTQTVQSTHWTVVHNLGVKPNVQVFVKNPLNPTGPLIEIFPEKITIIDLNNLTLDFAELESGVAQLTTASSANTVNAETVVVPVSEPFQLSSSSELTIATLNANLTISIGLTFKASPDQVVTYSGINNIPSIVSPWVGNNTVLIKNKVYTVRSFQILNPLILNGTIRNSTSVYFSALNGVAFNSEDILILLAKPPFQTADKITNEFVNVSKISSTLPEMYYTDGNMFIANTLITTTFPNIRKI